MPEHLPLFPPLVSSSRGKVVLAALGTPPPGLDTHGIGQSLATDQDEESILSDSHLDHHSNTLDSSIMWVSTPCAAQIKNRNHGPPSAETMDTGLVTRTATKIVTGNMRNPKRAITDMVQISLADALHGTKTMMVPMNAVLMANARDRMGMIVHLTATEQSRDGR